MKYRGQERLIFLQVCKTQSFSFKAVDSLANFIHPLAAAALNWWLYQELEQFDCRASDDWNG